jgi:hypothetical protein
MIAPSLPRQIRVLQHSKTGEKVEKTRKAQTPMRTSGEMLKAQEDPGSAVENGDTKPCSRRDTGWEECPSTGVDMSMP